MATGTVKWFNGAKGFGFIQPDEGGPDVFVHISAVERAGLRGLNEGQKVTYELGRMRAAASSPRANSRPSDQNCGPETPPNQDRWAGGNAGPFCLPGAGVAQPPTPSLNGPLNLQIWPGGACEHVAALARETRLPKRTDISSILIIGAGPIVIGQACEFDYSGVQACKALRAEGYRIILVNSNPATIMTDPDVADATYIEPITPEMVEKIIDKERPDALLPTMGGQTALNTRARARRWACWRSTASR